MKVRYLLHELVSSDLETRTRAATEIARIGRPAIDADLDAFLERCEAKVLQTHRYDRCEIIQWDRGRTNERVWLDGDHVLAIASGSDEPACIGLTERDWGDVLVSFHARAVKGTWSFLGRVDPDGVSHQAVPWDRIPVSTPEGRWVTVRIAVISGLYNIQVDDHVPMDLTPEPRNYAEFGAIGFQVDKGSELELKDVVVRVLTYRGGY